MGNKRKGHGYYWQLEECPSQKSGMERSVRGFTVDFLDSKSLQQASNSYEKVFILIRETLEKNNAACCDDYEDRLNLCQEISDILKENRLISRDGE
jgi:hypothetical protein